MTADRAAAYAEALAEIERRIEAEAERRHDHVCLCHATDLSIVRDVRALAAVDSAPTACGAEDRTHPDWNVSWLPCQKPHGHDGEHYATTGCAGGSRQWDSAPTGDARMFSADEVIEIANETSDSLGNLYRLDFIDRIRSEAGLGEDVETGGAA